MSIFCGVLEPTVTGFWVLLIVKHSSILLTGWETTGSLKLAMERVFTPQALANAAIGAFFPPLDRIFHDTTVISNPHTTHLILERIIRKAGLTDHIF